MAQFFSSELIYTLIVVFAVVAILGVVMALATAGMIMKPSRKKKRRRTKQPRDTV